MQCLNATPDMLLSYNDRNSGLNTTQGQLTNLFYLFLIGMRFDPYHTNYDPIDILDHVRKQEGKFEFNEEHDANEFLNSFLSLFDDEALEVHRQSIVNRAFGGTFCNSVLWHSCLHVKRDTQPFIQLIVDIPENERTESSALNANSYGQKHYGETK